MLALSPLAITSPIAWPKGACNPPFARNLYHHARDTAQHMLPHKKHKNKTLCKQRSVNDDDYKKNGGAPNPDLIIPAGASPHEYQLKPSNAKSLEDADIVFWMGEDLTPWLEKGLSSLAQDAAVTSLLSVDGIELLSFREGALFEAHDHDDHDDHDDHGKKAKKHDDHE